MESPAYIIGALDALVKAGAVSPSYAAGVADVIAKEADWTPLPDSNSQNILEGWQDFYRANRNNPNVVNRNPTAANPARVKLTGPQAQQMLRSSRHWWTDGLGRMGDAVGSFGSWLGNKFNVGAPSMSWEDMKRMHAVKQNRRDLAHLKRLEGEGAIIPQELYGALQDQHTRDAQTAWHTAGRFMSPGERAARYGATADEAKDRFRTAQGTAAIRSGMHDPVYDTQTAQPKTKAIQNNPMAGMFGSKDRQKLFSQSYRNGLGMY